jgi:hypothetical protein
VHGFPDEGAIAIGDLIDVGQKFADEGVRGFAAGNAEKHFFLLGVHACRVTQVDVLLRRRIVHAIVHYLLLIFILKLLSCSPKRHQTQRKARVGLDEEKLCWEWCMFGNEDAWAENTSNSECLKIN